MGDLEQAIAYALEPMTQQGRMELCPHCGVIKHNLETHVCGTPQGDIPGFEIDEKRRAKSYAVQ